MRKAWAIQWFIVPIPIARLEKEAWNQNAYKAKPEKIKPHY